MIGTNKVFFTTFIEIDFILQRSDERVFFRAFTKIFFSQHSNKRFFSRSLPKRIFLHSVFQNVFFSIADYEKVD